MDSQEESASMRDRAKHDRESETNCRKGSSKQRGQGECDENVFTSMSHETDSSFCPLNGPTVTANDVDHSSNRLLEISSVQNTSNSSHTNINMSTTTNYLIDPVCNNKSDKISCDNGLEPSQEKQTCQKHKVCLENVVFPHTYHLNAPSTSGASSSRAFDNLTEGSSSFRESRKRPSTLKLNKPNLNMDDSSSDTGNDDYSLGSEDGCIYTYRGGEHLADLPSSFFSLDMGLPLDKHLPMLPNYPVGQQAPANVREQNSRASSPDMDFLEMDFDPGPSCEVDTGDESTPDADLDGVNMPEENDPVIRGTSPEYLPALVQQHPIASTSGQQEHYHNVPSTSRIELIQEVPEHTSGIQTFGPYITHINFRGEQLLVRRTMTHWNINHSSSFHISGGDLISPREILNYDENHTEAPLGHQISQAKLVSSYHLTMTKKLMMEKAKFDDEGHDTASEQATDKSATTSECNVMGCVEAPRCMVWSEREACERQVTQIGTSACGATAVVNVFIALGVPVNIERINSAVGTRLRANNAPLPRYLLSRAVAGCTGADLVTGIQRSSDGLVTARFFPTYPERAVSLSHWLADWISLGAVPILTLNRQVGCEGEIPDAWHHQMVFGVSSHGVYLTNPIECIPESTLWPRLISPSVLLVKTRDILMRFTTHTDLTPLMVVPDRRFHTFNVLGQIVNVIREWRATGWAESGTRTRHVRLPASYIAGVTVAALTGSEAHRRLVHAPHLPLLSSHDPNRDPPLDPA